MADPSKRIDVESSIRVTRTDSTGVPQEYVQVIWTVYGMGPYKLFVPFKNSTPQTVLDAVERETHYHLVIMGRES